MSQAAPFGAFGRPLMKAYVFSSGAIMPARAPPSIDMLQTVMRPSIDSARMASPAYSMTEPVPPAVPISPMMARMMSFAPTPLGATPSTRTSMFLALLWISVCVASTCSTSRCADAVRQRAERAMCGGVAVAADNRRAGQREALLGADDVDDALALVALVEIFDAEVFRVLGQRLDLNAAVVVGDALGAIGGRHVVIDDSQRLFRRAHLAARHAETFERLRARDLVDQMPVDIEQARAVRLAIHDVVVENLVVEGLGCRLGSVWAMGAQVLRQS